MKVPSLALLLTTSLVCSALTQINNHNQSLCTDIQINDLHYFINLQLDSADLQMTEGNTTITYNLCKHVEVYCPYQN